MSEKVPNRREAAANEFEQTSQYQAMQKLKQLGVAKSLNQLQLFHGRAGDGKGNWRVDPSIDNSGNNTGHYNINQRPALNTGDYQTAHQFSIARAGTTASTAEIHLIMSNDPDAVILDDRPFSKLDAEQKKTLNHAISETLPGITEGSPLNFEDRHALDDHSPSDFKNTYGLMFDEDVLKVSNKLNLKPQVVLQIGSAINTKFLLCHGYARDLCWAFLDNQPTIDVKTSKDGQRTTPINHEYLSNWFRENHIVGYKQRVNSATLGQSVDNYLLFDLEKVNTDKELERKIAMRNRRFGRIAYMAYNNNILHERGSLVESLSNNLYIKPSEIIDLAKRTPGYKEVFESDAGNWEKYKLEEHTETVLELFDKNYADVLPASTLPLMRLALLVHDIGKPRAVERGKKSNQRRYNVAFADHFMRKNKVNESTIQLIETMIGEGMDLTKRWIIDREKGMATQFHQFCEDTMKEYLKVDRVDPETALGFGNMLMVLQTCDSAAYTTMAVTRNTKNDIRYKNSGAFDGSFDKYHGFTGRRARLE